MLQQAQEDAVEKATLLEQLNVLTERSRKDAEEGMLSAFKGPL